MPVKIGKSSRPERRLAALQTAHWAKLSLLAVAWSDDDDALEASLHATFRADLSSTLPPAAGAPRGLGTARRGTAGTGDPSGLRHRRGGTARPAASVSGLSLPSVSAASFAMVDDTVRALLEDPEYREALAENAYMRERVEDAAVAREHDVDDETTYHVLAWECLSDDSKRPYRTAIAEAFGAVISIAA